RIDDQVRLDLGIEEERSAAAPATGREGAEARDRAFARRCRSGRSARGRAASARAGAQEDRKPEHGAHGPHARRRPGGCLLRILPEVRCAAATIEREWSMGLVDRAKNIIVTPKTEWEAVAAQATPDSQVILGYVLPLAAIAALAGFIGMSLVGVSAPLVGTVRIGIVAGLVSAIYNVIMAIV